MKEQISQTESGIHVTGAPLTATTSSTVTPLLTSEIDSRIVKIRPMATPVDQLSRCGDVRHSGSMKVNYYVVDVKAVSAKISAYPGENDLVQNEDFVTAKIKVDNAAIYAVSETVLIPDLVENGTPMMLYLTDVGADYIEGRIINEVTLSEGYNFKFKPGTRVVRMGRAASELDVQTPQFEALPKRSQNYCQIFKMQVEESTLHRLSNKEAAWAFSDQEEVAIIDMRQGMEKNFIFGIRTVFQNGATNDDIYLTGGIWNQEGLKEHVYDPTALTEGELISICREVFTGTNGSARKILIGGSGMIEALSRLKTERVLVGQTTLTRWGLEFHEIKSNFGTLYVIHSEIFNQCGHENDGMIIDPNLMTKYVHIPFTTEKLDLRTSGQRNTEAVVITEASCLVLRNPASHMRLIGRAGQAAAALSDDTEL